LRPPDGEKACMRYASHAPDGEDPFDADAALFSGEMRGLIPDLIAALGGALTRDADAADPAAARAQPALA
jgi:recombination associated protein RdgC